MHPGLSLPLSSVRIWEPRPLVPCSLRGCRALSRPRREGGLSCAAPRALSAGWQQVSAPTLPSTEQIWRGTDLGCRLRPRPLAHLFACPPLGTWHNSLSGRTATGMFLKCIHRMMFFQVKLRKLLTRAPGPGAVFTPFCWWMNEFHGSEGLPKKVLWFQTFCCPNTPEKVLTFQMILWNEVTLQVGASGQL